MGSWYRFYQKYFMDHCVSFSGRLSRQEYLCRQMLLMLSIFLPGTVLFLAVLPRRSLSLEEFSAAWSFYFAWACIILLIIALLITSISLTVRRLHDLDRSGWWFLLLLVPAVNAFILMWLSCAQGTQGGNSYGSATTAVNRAVFWDDVKNRQQPLTSLIQYFRAGTFFKDYFTFKGRLTCREYFFLFMAPSIVWSITALMGKLFYWLWLHFVGAGEAAYYLGLAGNTVNLVINLLMVLLLLMIDVRRSHDHGTGWYYSLLALIPLANFIYMVRQFCLTGDEYDNKYGSVRTYTDANGTIYNDDY